MKFGFTLIITAAFAGLAGALVPGDGGAMLVALLKHQLPKGIAVLLGFGIPLAIASFALAKQRMSKMLGIASLFGFVAAAAAVEILSLLKFIGQNPGLIAEMPVQILLIVGGVVLGIVGSMAAIIKGNND